jgi:hypothetical protein
MENNTVKYFKYAIGEIVLVMIGILLALQVNNWNENRVKNLTIKSYLNNLMQDFKGEQVTLDVIIEYHSYKFHSMQYLLKMEGTSLYDPIADRKTDIPEYKPILSSIWLKEQPLVYDEEYIQVVIGYMHRAVVPPFPRPTLQELKSTGMYSKLNPILKEEINLYYLYIENDFNGKPQSLAMDFQESLAEDGFITTDTNKLTDPISLLKNNPKRIGLVKRMIRESGWTVQSAIRLKERNEKLVELLEKEIESL